ncbi:MAG: hypothetical protein JOY80_10040 [Candidatus Dormibacteraeota bacterium]|nr:hypothetical protein [Candidatus Dormibacteraeota bacterium]
MRKVVRTDREAPPAAKRRALYGMLLVAALAAASLVAFSSPNVAHAQTAGSLSANTPLCSGQTGDNLDAGLQGQIAASQRALPGPINCNLTQVASYAGHTPPCTGCTVGYLSTDFYSDGTHNCLYINTGQNFTVGMTAETFSTEVVDVTNPLHPVETDDLTTAAMQSPWESVRVNQARGLLVADSNAEPYLDVYSVKADCTHPTLLFTGNMPKAEGHEGWFSPDGTVYWMSCLCSNGVWPIDLTDPSHPVQMTTAALEGGATIHGGSVSTDGNRVYMCATSPDELITLDSSGVQSHLPNPTVPVVGMLALPDNGLCQETYPVSYKGQSYVIQFGEVGSNLGGGCGAAGSPPGTNPTGLDFSSATLINNADDTAPTLTHDIITQINDPANCAQATGQQSAPPPGLGDDETAGFYGIFVYGPHMCSPDRLVDPTILACAEEQSGLHVYDIRDPNHVSELAYWDPGPIPGTPAAGSAPGTPGSLDMFMQRPIIDIDHGLIYVNGDYTGLHVLKFENSVYPFASSTACPSMPDYYFDQYNPASSCLNPATSTPEGLPLLMTLGSLGIVGAASGLAVRRRRSRRTATA